MWKGHHMLCCKLQRAAACPHAGLSPAQPNTTARSPAPSHRHFPSRFTLRHSGRAYRKSPRMKSRQTHARGTLPRAHCRPGARGGSRGVKAATFVAPRQNFTPPTRLISLRCQYHHSPPCYLVSHYVGDPFPGCDRAQPFEIYGIYPSVCRLAWYVLSRRCGPDGPYGAWEPAAGKDVVRLHIDGLPLQPPNVSRSLA